jgi:hypothetical protein
MLFRMAVLSAAASFVLGISPAAPAAGKPDLHIRIARAGPTTLSVKAHMYTTVLLENRGTATAGQIVLWIRVPKTLSIRSPDAHVPSGGCLPRGRDWRCELGSLAPGGAPIEVEVDARAVKAGAGTFRLTVTAHQRDAHPADNGRAIHVRVRQAPARANLSVSAESAETPEAGIPAALLFHVRNTGPSAADQVTLRVELKSDGWFVGADYVSKSTFDDCAPTDEDQKVIVCTVAFVAPHGTATVALEGYLRVGQARLAMRVNSTTKDTFPRNNAGSFTAAVGPPLKTADLALVPDVPPQVSAEQPVGFKLQVTNHGPDDAHDVEGFFVVFTKDNPVAIDLVSVSATQGECAGLGCDIGTVAAGETVTLTLVLVFHGTGTFTVGGITTGRNDAYDPGLYEDAAPASSNGSSEDTVVGSPAQARSFSRSRSLTTRGFAFPRVSFMTCPTRKPSSPSLPARYAAACSSLSARTWSITGSSSDASAISVSPR